MNELISVVVPVYNAEKHLARSVGSLLRQTYGNLEILLVDDGSTDAGPAMCDAYAMQDSRVRVLHTENHGQAHARNIGIDAAAGEYIGFMDADDDADPAMYEVLYHLITEYDADMAGCGHSSIYGDRVDARITDDVTFCDPKEAIGLFATGTGRICRWSLCDKLFRRDRIGSLRIDEHRYLAEDTRFILSFLQQNQRFVFVERALYHYYRSVNGSFTKAQWGERNLGLTYFYRELCDAVRVYDLTELIPSRECRYYENLLSAYVRAKKCKLADYKQIRSWLRAQIRAEYPRICANRRLKCRYKILFKIIRYKGCGWQ